MVDDTTLLASVGLAQACPNYIGKGTWSNGIVYVYIAMLVEYVRNMRIMVMHFV